MKKIFLMVALISTTILSTVNAQSAAVKSEFNNTLTSYFEVKNGLANDDAKAAASSSEKLLKEMASFPVKSLSAAQKKSWVAFNKEVSKSLKTIAGSEDIKVQRESFTELANGMVKLATALKLNSSEIYVQYCPHAKKSWLNDVKAVQNPYYGSMMYSCGSVKETLAAK